MTELSTNLQFVKGIGPRIAAGLATRNLHTVEDLLYHLPFRYEDRLNPRALADLVPGEMASVIGEVRSTILLRTRAAPIFEMVVGQGLSSVKCMWFNGTYLRDRFHLGQLVALYGKLEPSRSKVGALKMIQPQFEILPSGTGPDAEYAALEVNRIVPIYSTLGGTTAWGAKLTSRWHRRVLFNIFEDLSPDEPIETLPQSLLTRLKLPNRIAALKAAHFPSIDTSITDLQSFATPAHRRLIFEELFYLELGLELKRRRMRDRNGIAFTTTPAVREAIKQVLPFHPTAAQKRVLAEIVADMRLPNPMRRLLQGDVGSGKTIVALQAAIVAMENGYQAALMAPTEILATQHYLSARKLLERSQKPYRITLLTGSLDPHEKRAAHGRIMRNESQLVIGTQALFQQKVDFANLGLVIIDEQHRFGVQQRFQLMRKPNAADPDTLVMTATPIPRTLALTLYGDLDASVIDQLPPGRTPITTRRTTEARAAEVWSFVRKQVAAGHQAYIVYPTIEGPKDDQPELDFAHDETSEPNISSAGKDTGAPRLASETWVRSSPTTNAVASGVAGAFTPRTPASASGVAGAFDPRTSAHASEVAGAFTPRTPANLKKGALAPEVQGAPAPPSAQSADPETARAFRPVNKASATRGALAPGPSPEASTPPSSGTIRKGTVSTVPSQASFRAGASAPAKRTKKPQLFAQEKIPLRSATAMYDELRAGPLAGLRLGLLHGRLPADEKDVIMQRFKRGEIDVLIATTVIEVGVDVPNASLMVIDHAERFGLAQLHQLRGRVGRGAAKSFCLLITSSKITDSAEARLTALTNSQNGFELAEFDLNQRGPGEFFGTRQAGLPDFRVANLLRDRHLLELAKQEAHHFAHAPNPTIPKPQIEAVWSTLKQQ